jgi:hypothetical protein
MIIKRALVPEAAVYEDGKSACREYDVGLALEVRVDPVGL